MYAKTIHIHQEIWPFGSQLSLSEISHLQACYHISRGRFFFFNLVRIFPSMSSCANTKNNSGPSTNLASDGLMDFSCVTMLFKIQVLALQKVNTQTVL